MSQIGIRGKGRIQPSQKLDSESNIGVGVGVRVSLLWGFWSSVNVGVG